MSARDPARGQPAEGMIGEKWRISLLKKIYVIGCFTNMKSGTFKSAIFGIDQIFLLLTPSVFIEKNFCNLTWEISTQIIVLLSGLF